MYTSIMCLSILCKIYSSLNLIDNQNSEKNCNSVVGHGTMLGENISHCKILKEMMRTTVIIHGKKC